MSDTFTASTVRLEQLLGQIMKETDPFVYDQLAEEIWRVLAQREQENNANKNDQPKAA